MRWVSDDGEVAVIASTPGGKFRRVELADEGGGLMALRSWRPHGWAATIEIEGGIAGVEHVLVVDDGDEVIVRWARVRLGAEGTEDDPRVVTREWRCARVIEGEATT